MSDWYNPIVRTFCRCRRVLMDVTGLPRERFRPDARLNDLIPPSRRQAAWEALDAVGLPTRVYLPPAACLVVMGLLCLALWWVGSWAGVLAAVAAFLPLLIAFSYLVGMFLAQVGPPGMTTLGDLVMWCTHPRDHRASGYHWSRGDIAHKVRLIVADQSGVPLDRIREDTRFVDDLGMD
jgi:hypothetical protein